MALYKFCIVLSACSCGSSWLTKFATVAIGRHQLEIIWHANIYQAKTILQVKITTQQRPLAKLYLKKWWWPVASPGFGVRGARRSRRQSRRVPWSGVWGGVSAPQPTRESEGASWAPPAGSGTQPRSISHFLHILGHRTLLIARKILWSLDLREKLQILLWKSGGDSHHSHLSPRDRAMRWSCQLKSCQLPRNSAETTYTTSPDRIDGIKLEI